MSIFKGFDMKNQFLNFDRSNFGLSENENRFLDFVKICKFDLYENRFLDLVKMKIDFQTLSKFVNLIYMKIDYQTQ